MFCNFMSAFSRACRLSAATAIIFAVTAPVHAIIIESGTSGRFISVTNNGGVSRLLHVGEIEAFTTGATVSSTSLEPAYDKARTTLGASFESQIGPTAHGGNTAPLDAILNSGAAVFTLNSGVGNQMVYDLGATHNLSTVRLWQRQDACCQDRLSNFTVAVLADNGGGLPGVTTFSQSFPGQVATESFTEFDTLTGRQIQPGNVGVIGTDVVGETAARFLRVRNNSDGNRHLGIGEIEVFATGVTPNAGSGLSTNELTGITFESQIAPAGVAHGSNSAPFNNALDSGAAVYTLETTPGGNEYVIDLNANVNVGEVRMFNRVDCCQGRLSNYTVSLLKDNGAGVAGDEVFAFNVSGQTPNTPSFTQINVPTLPDAFNLRATDNLVIDIDGAANLADLLSVGSTGQGALTITPGATLTLNFLSAPGNGQTFNILDFGSSSGAFGAINTIGLPNYLTLNTSSLGTTGQFSTVFAPEPASVAVWTIIGLVGAGFGYRKLRRKK